MNGKEFFEQMPYLAKGDISDINRRRLSELFGVIYQYEKDHELSAFARCSEDIEDPYNRTRMAFDLLRCMGGDNDRIAYMEEKVVNKAYESYSVKKKATGSKAKKTFFTFSDIDASLTASSSTSSADVTWWNS